MFSDLLFLMLIFGSVTALLVAASIIMSKTHALEVYLIWYVHSFFLVLFLGLEIIRQTSDIQGDATVIALCGQYINVCGTIYYALIDMKGEAELIAVVLALIIGPQLITYVLSGLVGCASAPLFVGQATQIAMWSVIKFMAGLGAILLAHAIARFFTQETPFDRMGPLFFGYLFTCAAFLLGVVVALVEQASSYVRRELFEEKNKELMRAMVKAQRWMKRNRSQEKSKPYVLEVHVHLPELNKDLHARTRFKIV